MTALLATCHPDRPYFSKGLCAPCHNHARYLKYAEERRERQRRYNAEHAERVVEYQRRRRKEDPIAVWASKRNSFLKTHYGISSDDYQRMFAEQGGLCAICGRPPTNERLCVDHDADTGRVRGLLCRKCNIGIGHLNHDPGSLATAIEYLAPKLALQMKEQGIG